MFFITRYDELDAAKTIAENLAGKTVVEYPTFHIILNERAGNYTDKMGEFITTTLNCIDRSMLFSMYYNLPTCDMVRRHLCSNDRVTQ